MENVDQMIFDSLLNDLHCSFGDNDKDSSSSFKSLGDLGSDQIVEGIVRCLWKCNANTRNSIPSFKLPKNAVDRFRIASKISHEIKSLGVRDQQIGYQVLLYPNVFETRRIFLTLFEKLPKETVNEDEKILTPFEKLKADVAAVIDRQLAEHWTPEFCRFYDLQKIGHFWHPKDQQQQQSALNELWAKIDGHIGGIGEEENMMEQLEEKVKLPTIAQKPKLPPKPKLSTQKIDEKRSEPDPEIIEKEKKIAEIKAKLVRKQNELMEIQIGINQMAKETNKLEKRTTEANDERLLILLEDPEGNMEKLQKFVAEANTRRVALQEKFFAAKAEKLEQLGLEKSNENGRGRSDRLAQLNRGIETLEELTEQRKRIRAKLLKECQKMGDNGQGKDKQQAQNIESRNKFVQRILEISAMVAKQNDEIRRTANSVQTIRREIDLLEGTLDRTFTAVNRWMAGAGDNQRLAITTGTGGHAKMLRTHKLLVRTHEQCALVKEAIQSQGQLSRQIDELADRVDLEGQKGVDAQLERLLDDLMIIRSENHEIERKLDNNQREEGIKR